MLEQKWMSLRWSRLSRLVGQIGSFLLTRWYSGGGRGGQQPIPTVQVNHCTKHTLPSLWSRWRRYLGYVISPSGRQMLTDLRTCTTHLNSNGWWSSDLSWSPTSSYRILLSKANETTIKQPNQHSDKIFLKRTLTNRIICKTWSFCHCVVVIWNRVQFNSGSFHDLSATVMMLSG